MHPRESSSRAGGSTFFKKSLSPGKASKRYQFDLLFWCFSIPKSTKSRFFEHPKNHWNFRIPFFRKSLKTTPKWNRSFHALTPLFPTLFLIKIFGAQMGSQGPSRVPRRWFSGGLAIVFDHFLMHLGTRLKGKSTVAEQRGCALDTQKGQKTSKAILFHTHTHTLQILH